MITNFRLLILIRVLIIVLMIIGSVWLWNYTTLVVTKFMAVTITTVLVYDLVLYVERTNRKLSNIFEAIKYSDFTRSFSMNQMGNSFDSLDKALNEVMVSFHKAREEREEALRYLETIVQHVGTGLMVFNQKGEIETINAAAKRLFNILTIKNIKDLKSLSLALVDTLETSTTGNNHLIKINAGGQEKTIAIAVTEFRKKESIYKVVSFRNIQSELQSKEFEAWQNITRVMTHEIVNSITPIASLSGTVNQMIAQEIQSDGKLTDDTLKDVQEAMYIIERRSEGLKHFVDAYRRFGSLPKPNFKPVAVKQLLDHAVNLYKAESVEYGVSLKAETEPHNLQFNADPELIEMVLINLIKNAMQASQGIANASVKILGKMDNQGHIVIEITDNGKGIIPEAIDKIFIPFFTTKQGGTGIGLSLSRQIMHLHDGTLQVESKPDISTTFMMRF